MRTFSPRRVAALLALGAAVAPALPAAAQDLAPEVESLIQNLQPPQQRGIRLPAAPGAPAATPAAAAPTARPGSLTATTAPSGVAAVSLTVNFATGTAELSPAAAQVVEALARALASPALAPYRFRIEGHTDSVGARSLNQDLSERRAAAVRDHLVTRHGIAPQRLEAVGLGEQQLLVPTPDDTAEPRNRRVQIVNLGG